MSDSKSPFGVKRVRRIKGDLGEFALNRMNRKVADAIRNIEDPKTGERPKVTEKGAGSSKPSLEIRASKKLKEKMMRGDVIDPHNITGIIKPRDKM